MPEISERIHTFESELSPYFSPKYLEILQDYQERLSQIEAVPGAREGIDPLVADLLYQLENGGTEDSIEKAYIDLLGRLRVYIHEHLFTFRDLEHSVIVDEVSTEEAQRVITQIDGTIAFLDAVKNEENDPVKRGSLGELITLLQTYKTNIKDGIRNGSEAHGYFQDFITELEQKFSRAILAANEIDATTQSVRDMLIAQLNDIRELRNEYMREKALSDAEFQRQREASRESLMFESYDTFGEDILTEIYGGFYPTNINTNSPELDIARDKIFDVAQMSDISEVTAYGRDLQFSPNLLESPTEVVADWSISRKISEFFSEDEVRNIDEALSIKINDFLINNPNFLNNFPGVTTVREFKEKFILDFGIAITGSIRESFEQLQNQLEVENGTTIVFQTTNDQGNIEERSIDFSVLYSDKTDASTYIADPTQRLEAQRLARQKSIVSGMIFLQRLEAESLSHNNLLYMVENVFNGVVSVASLDVIDIPFFEERLENAITQGIAIVSLSHLAYRTNFIGNNYLLPENMRFRYSASIRKLFATHINSDEANMRSAGLNQEQIDAIKKLQFRTEIIHYYITEAQKAGDTNLETRLRDFQNSKLFYLRNADYFHNHLHIINESNFIRRSLSLTSRFTTLGAVVNQARRYVPTMPRNVEGNLIMRNYRRIKGIGWGNLERYHETLVKFDFLPSHHSPGISETSSRMLGEFVRRNEGDISNLSDQFRQINAHIGELNNLAGGMFDSDFSSAIEHHITAVLNGPGDANNKMQGLLVCFEEKSQEAKNIRTIFDSPEPGRRIDLSQSPELRDTLLRNIRTNVQEINSGAVSDRSDYISRIAENSEKINATNSGILGFQYDRLSPEQNSAIQQHFRSQLNTSVDTGIDLDNKVTGIIGKVTEFSSGLETGKYDSILDSLFLTDQSGRVTTNTDQLRAFLHHRSDIATQTSGRNPISSAQVEGLIDSFKSSGLSQDATGTDGADEPRVAPERAADADADILRGLNESPELNTARRYFNINLINSLRINPSIEFSETDISRILNQFDEAIAREINGGTYTPERLGEIGRFVLKNNQIPGESLQFAKTPISIRQMELGLASTFSDDFISANNGNQNTLEYKPDLTTRGRWFDRIVDFAKRAR